MTQRLVDQALLTFDGDTDKSRLGANAILGVSLAVAKAAADSARLPLFRYLGGPNAHILRCDDEHCQRRCARRYRRRQSRNSWSPPSARRASRGAALGCQVYHSLKSVLKKHGAEHRLGDEGGFAPDIAGTTAALDLISTAIEGAGFKTRCGRWRWHSTPPRPDSTPKAPGTRSRRRPAPPRQMTEFLRRSAGCLSVDLP